MSVANSSLRRTYLPRRSTHGVQHRRRSVVTESKRRKSLASRERRIARFGRAWAIPMSCNDPRRCLTL